MDRSPLNETYRFDAPRIASQGRSQSTIHDITGPITPRQKFRRRRTGSMTEQKLEDDHSLMSDSEEHEMNAIGSDVEVDEETGLAAEEQRKYVRQKRRKNQLDKRIAGDGALDSRRQADKDVVKRLVINAMLIVLWYLFSLSISIYNKWMFSPDKLDFHFPLFTTSLHMLVQFVLAFLILAIFPSLRPQRRESSRNADHTAISSSASTSSIAAKAAPLVTPLFYFTRLVPTGTTTSLDIGLGNTSLQYITLTFYTMCKSSVLIFVLLFAFLFRLEAVSLKLVLIIVSMTIGVLMMVAGETEFSALGFALALSASFFSGFRWALTQILLLRHPATNNPFATLFFLAPIMFLTLFAIALVSEQPEPVIVGLNVLVAKEGLAKACLLLFIPGALAFCMIASEFTLLQRTSVVTLSICGIFKEVVTISAAGIVFGDKLTPINILGLVVTIVAIASYNYLKVTKMRKEARSRLGLDGGDENSAQGNAEADGSSSGSSGSAADRRGRSRQHSLHKNKKRRSGSLRRTDGNVTIDEANVPLMHGSDSANGHAR